MLIEGLVGVVALIAAASLTRKALLRHQRRPRHKVPDSRTLDADRTGDRTWRSLPTDDHLDLATIERAWSAANRCAAGPAAP